MNRPYIKLLALASLCCLALYAAVPPGGSGGARNKARRSNSNPPAAGSIPTGNVWTFAGASNNAGTSADIANVSAGDIVVCFIKWETAGNVSALSLGGTSTNFVLNPTVDFNDGLLHVRTGYVLNPPLGTFNNCVVTTNGVPAPTFIGITLARFNASGTKSFDTSASGTNTSANLASGTFTTGAQNTLVFQGYGKYSGATLGSFLIGGASATRTPAPENEIITWYAFPSSQIVNGTGNATLTPSDPWITALETFIAQ